ncbi:hypothetical protein O3M35_001652 [Rhynocoris fuscipes]|uniref:UDP-glucuronosyltransferase n=1 Tax=Rhynocoris fuscipes TaxID=488301 RepID=A0AAW1CP76_9HEMI
MRMYLVIYSLAIFLFSDLIFKINCSEILLLFPAPFRSHYYALLPIIRALADKGHKITSHSALEFGPHPNINETLIENKLDADLKRRELTTVGTLTKLLMELHDMGYASALNFLNTPQFKELLETDQKYDATIAVTLTIQEYLVALQHKFNTINIEIVPHANSPSVHHFTGTPFNPTYFVDVKLPYTDRMSFWQRLHNTFNYLVTILLSYMVNIRRMQSLADQYIRYPGWEKRPALDQLMSNRSLVLINGHHSLNYPYPSPPHVIDIAGVSIREIQPLPKDFKTFINGWPNGIVMLSWGSVVSGSITDNENMVKILLTAFSRLKYGVIWKTNTSTYSYPVPENVMMVKWLPQQEILADKRTKVFITHCGFNSMVETVYYGVPVVVTPFFLDQSKNARKLVDIGMGVQLTADNLTTDAFIWAINEVANNKRYKEAAVKQSAMFRDRPFKPVDEAVYWIEYVMKHGDVLQPASIHIPLYRLLWLDIIAFSIIILLILFYLFKTILSITYNKLSATIHRHLINKKNN